MVHPASGTAPLAHPDMPEEIAADFEEAREIADQSPRGAAALLRLVIEKLCAHHEARGARLDQQIGYLVANHNLPSAVQKALDTVRVIGNSAVHPGQIELSDDAETAGKLFGLVNFIVEKTITEPKEIDALYARVPDGAKKAIEKRDGISPPDSPDE